MTDPYPSGLRLLRSLLAHRVGRLDFARCRTVIAESGPIVRSEQVFDSTGLSQLGVRRFGDRYRVARGPHPHELRHTAASMASASGADVKVVQQIPGHR